MIAGQLHSSTFQVKLSSGQLTNADGLPTVKVYLDGVLTAIDPTVENLSTGVYRYSFTLPGNWVSGQSVDLHLELQADNKILHTKKNYTIETPSTVTPEQLRDAIFNATAGTQ